MVGKEWENYCMRHLYAMILGKQSPLIAKYCYVGMFLDKYGKNINRRDNWIILSKIRK